MRKLQFVAIALTIALPAHAEKTLKISAAISPQANVFAFVTKPFEQASGIKIVYTNKDPKGQGGDLVFKDVDQGVAEAGASGTVWEDWLKLMKEKGYVPKNADRMHTRVFGRDRIQFMTDKSGPSELSEAQLKGLLTGKIVNWKEVGGQDQPVVLIITEDQPATAKFLEERFLGGQKLAWATAKVVKKSEGIAGYVKLIGATKGGIGFGPVNAVTDAVKVPKAPIVGRPLTMVWIDKPSAELLQFLEFIEKEGPKLGVVQ